MKRIVSSAVMLACFVAGGLLPLSANGDPSEAAEPTTLDISDLLGGLDQFGPPDMTERLRLSAEFQTATDSLDGWLSITAEPAPGWHFYSITQPAGGPMATELTVQESAEFVLSGRFTADRAPRVHEDDIFDVPLEEHHERVTWSAPIRLTDGVDPTHLAIAVSFDGQICSREGSCIPISGMLVEAKFAGFGEVVIPTPIATGSELTSAVTAEVAPDSPLTMAVAALIGCGLVVFIPLIALTIGLIWMVARRRPTSQSNG